jgi:uncharacterized protein YaaN involved in tellurite resistance
VDIETSKNVNTELISTIEETLRIHEEGRANRRQPAGELPQMERELKERLREARASAPRSRLTQT